MTKLLRRLFGFVWHALNFTRRLIANLLLILLILALIPLFRAAPVSPVPDGVALLIRPQGDLPEQLERTDTLDLLLETRTGSPEAPLHRYIEAIDAAAKDPRITALTLETDDLLGGGLGRLTELRDALLRFRATGKPVYAWGSRYTQSQYYLASAANETYLAPDGALLLPGLARNATYYKNALDTIGVKVNVFRVGEYKSFSEPFTRTGMSDEDRTASLDLITGLWQQMRTAIAQTRKLSDDALTDYANHYPDHLQRTQGDAALAAKNAKLIDGLLTPDQWRAHIQQRVGADPEDKDRYHSITPNAYLARTHTPKENAPTIAVLTVQGTIIDGDSQAGTTGGDTLAQQIRDARNDDTVRALLIRIDSPGGSAYASELIRRELQLTRNAGKPVVASMSATAASGGYWIASGADEIWAQPGTITGSIGIFALLPEFADTANRLGITTDGVATGPLADQPDPLRPLPPQAAQSLQLLLDHGYRRFLQTVAESRKMTLQEVDQLARGRVWTGEAAHKLGLVDHLGTLPQALQAAADRAGIAGTPRIQWHTPDPSLGEQLLALGRELTHSATTRAPRPAPGAQLLTHWRTQLNALNWLNDPQHLYAHCFCELQ